MFVAIVALQFNKVKELLGIADKGTLMTILDEPDAATAFDNSKQTMVQIHIYTDISGTESQLTSMNTGIQLTSMNTGKKLTSMNTENQLTGTTSKCKCTDSVNTIRLLNSVTDGKVINDSEPLSDNNSNIVNPAITDSDIYGTFGSGSIWEYNEDSILVVTNYHVISPVVTKHALGYVVFYNGVISEFTVAAFDDDADCAFLLIDASCMTQEQLGDLRCVVPYDQENSTLSAEEPMFVVHSAEISREDMVSGNTLNMIADTSYVGYIMDPSVYVSALFQDMLYCKCSADAGMSGGPTFDAYGHYIGMLTGATDSGETVSVLLSDIETVYAKIN